MIARSATGEFAIQILEVYQKRFLSHVGKCQHEIRAIHSRDAGRPLLRDTPLLIPLDSGSKSQFLVECSRSTLQQRADRIR